ncbi:formyl transferase [Sphingomonas sp.]|uniref:glucosamine inositolphosphorylceramide transferase family protein n=1 Tax=Sphingomonas sp. TaxID=28214 RepID=UPI0025DED8A6|nr:formyl transferase [Sphingomonas sp.]
MDIWRTGIVCLSLAEVLARGGIDGLPIRWLPQPSKKFSFLADPFGLERDGKLHVFVEALDYRDRRGRIEVFSFDKELDLVGHGVCLSEPWHLSYPFVFEAEGDIYMLPEAYRSGGLTLYRATDFPRRWEAVSRIKLPEMAVDATPMFHGGKWWIFCSPVGRKKDELHVVYADRLEGPWTSHRSNPVRRGNDGSRPGGTPILIDGSVVLPVQDCSTTYGEAARALRFNQLTTDKVSFELGDPIRPPPSLAPFDAGLHTLSACGPFTLLDVKRIDRSFKGSVIGRIGKVRRAVAGFHRPWRGTTPG